MEMIAFVCQMAVLAETVAIPQSVDLPPIFGRVAGGAKGKTGSTAAEDSVSAELYSSGDQRCSNAANPTGMSYVYSFHA